MSRMCATALEQARSTMTRNPGKYRIGISMLAAAVSLVAATSGHAQYQWRDGNGHMVFSDQPPPSNIKPSQILRAEPMKSAPPPSGNVSFSGARATGESSGPRPVARADTAAEKAADRELEARRKQQGGKDTERKQKEEAEQAAKMARACDDAKAEIRTLESGIRIARINDQGEREYLGDEQRAARLGSVQRDVRDLCKAG
jgi:Domain of unknown function (DUF4124)